MLVLNLKQYGEIMSGPVSQQIPQYQLINAEPIAAQPANNLQQEAVLQARPQNAGNLNGRTVRLIKLASKIYFASYLIAICIDPNNSGVMGLTRLEITLFTAWCIALTRKIRSDYMLRNNLN